MSKVITIDGPSASGKGTLARELAKRINFIWLDTGLIYRSVAWQIIQKKLPVNNDSLTICSENITLPIADSPDLRTSQVSSLASKIATSEFLRSRLLPIQQQFAHNPPDKYDGVVIDGRDAGSVIFPLADAKFYLDASPESRAKRRFLELKNSQNITLETITQQIIKRDQQDSNRKIAPLVVPENAIYINNSYLSIEKTLEICLERLNSMSIILS